MVEMFYGKQLAKISKIKLSIAFLQSIVIEKIKKTNSTIDC